MRVAPSIWSFDVRILGDLARISHTLSATVRHMPVTTTFRLVRVVDVLLEYACGLPAERDAPCIDRHLTHLATKQCEIPGLVLHWRKSVNHKPQIRPPSQPDCRAFIAQFHETKGEFPGPVSFLTGVSSQIMANKTARCNDAFSFDGRLTSPQR